MDEDVIDLKKLFFLYLRKWWLIFLIAIIGGVIGFCYSRYMIAPQYESHITLFVKSNIEKTTMDTSLSELNTAKALVDTYIAVLQDDVVMREVGTRLMQQYGYEKTSLYFNIKMLDGVQFIEPDDIRNHITMGSVNDTEVLRIKARTTDPYLSAQICNIVAEIAPEFLVRVVGAGSIESIGDATVELQKVAPSNLKNAVIGAVIAGLLVCGILTVVELLNNTVKDKETLIKRFDKPIVGEIGYFKVTDRKDGKHVGDLRWGTTPFYIVEAYKEMRTNIMFSLATKQKKIIAVTSANPGEGKSTTAANLAISLSQVGKKVILIDGDMRKPIQHKRFGLLNQRGLSGVVSNMDVLDKAINKEVADHLDILTSGSLPPNPSELLASEQMRTLLQQLEQEYDYVIIDTPPINVVSDTLGLASMIGGLVLVTKFAQTSYEEIKNSLKKVDMGNMDVLGFTLNAVEKKGMVYKSKYGKYSKKYTSYEYKATEA